MIHQTAIVDPGARIGANVEIGPYSLIGADVEIGDGCRIGPHVVINGHTRIGRDNRIFQFATVGEENQDKKYAGEPTRVELGDHNVIREHVTIHRGTTQDSGVTRIGSHNLLMVNTHIAHDCVIGDHCIFANNATLAGHVQVDDYAIIGGMSAIHQFSVIGAHVMLGGGSIVVQDVPPYVMAQGNHAKPFGINIEGLKRRGFEKSTLHAIRRIYKELYRSGRALEEVKALIAEQLQEEPALARFAEFFDRSERGIIR